MYIRKVDSKIIGLLFILPLLFYGIGNSLVETILTVEKPFSVSSELKIGGLLMILNSITVIGIGILLFPILKGYHKVIASTYLISRVLEALLLLVGIIAVFSIIPLSQNFTATEKAIEFQNFSTFAFGINYYAYQISMLLLGLGSIPFCYLMYKQKLIPSDLAIWGCIGYVLLFIGSICELLGYKIGIAFSIPGGLFELGFGLWLIIKGFRNYD